MPKKILATNKGKVIKLSDGKEYTMAPFTLNTLANMEEEFDCDLDELQSKFAGRTATTFRKLLWILLRENYPEMTKEDAGKLVLLSEMKALIEEITGALGELKV